MAQSGGHAGHSHGEESMSDGRLVLAVALNVLLTVAQIIGGILSIACWMVRRLCWTPQRAVCSIVFCNSYAKPPRWI